MAAGMAPAVGLLLLLALLPSTASSGLVFDLVGNVYPNGNFHITMYIGDPAKPYFLDMDTGSKLTWVECGARRVPCQTCSKPPHPLYGPPGNKLVRCTDPLCRALRQDVGTPPSCHENVCNYKIQYADGSSSVGMLVQDKFTFPSGATDPAIAFGCGCHQGCNPDTATGVDGMLGLGRGSLDLVSQLKNHRIITKNVFAHCLSSNGRGYLSIGDENVLSKPVNWVPMAPRTPRTLGHYSPGRATLHLDTKPIGASTDVVLDSGSTYTVLPNPVYQKLIFRLKASLSSSVKLVRDPSMPPDSLCWRAPGVFKSWGDIKREFKSMSLNFDHGATMMIPPEKYLVITKYGNACLGIHATEVSVYIIGDITMQDQIVIYDNENGRLGWGPSQCDKKPNSQSAIMSRI